MAKVKIITNRLPQPGHHLGALLDVEPERAAMLVKQGFGEIIEAEEPAPVVRRGRPPKRAQE